MPRLTSLPLALALGALALGGCQSSTRNVELAYVERPVEQIYNNAANRLDARDYAMAIRLFEEVERQHPYSEWARKSMGGASCQCEPIAGMHGLLAWGASRNILNTVRRSRHRRSETPDHRSSLCPTRLFPRCA